MDVQHFLEGASEKVKSNFESQANNRTWGLERENQAVRADGSVPRNRLHQQTLTNEAENYDFLVLNASSDPRSPRNTPKELELDPEALAEWAKKEGVDYDSSERAAEGPNPVTDVDLWNQIELGTSAWEDFSGMLGEAEAMYHAAEQNLPERLEFNNRGVSESITYNEARKGLTFDDADQPYDFIDQFFSEISDKGRYIDYVKFLGPGVLLNGLTGSVQVSGQPKQVFNEIEENTSQYVVGDEEKPGIMALKPIQRIPFANSLLYGEDGDIETTMARKKVWDLTSASSPVMTKEEGKKRHGMQPEFFERAESGEEYGIGFEDFLDVLTDRQMIFTAGVEEDRLEYLDDGSEIHERYDHIESDQAYNVIVMSPDRDPESTQTLGGFIDTQEVEGMISIESEDGEIDEIPVEASYSEMSGEDFFDVAWDNTKVQEGTNWPYDRLRMDGWFEDRVECDSEHWDLSAIHSGVWKQKWQELQEAAAELGIGNEHAEALETDAYNRGEKYQLAQSFYDETMEIHYEGAKELVGEEKADEYIAELQNSLYGEGSPATRESHSQRVEVQ